MAMLNYQMVDPFDVGGFIGEKVSKSVVPWVCRHRRPPRSCRCAEGVPVGQVQVRVSPSEIGMGWNGVYSQL